MGAEIRAHVGLVRFSSHLQVLRSVGVGAGVDVQRAFDWLRRNDGNIICPLNIVNIRNLHIAWVGFGLNPAGGSGVALFCCVLESVVSFTDHPTLNPRAYPI